MRQVARPGKASWMSSRRSQQMRSRRNPWSQEIVRSTTHRKMPRPEPCGWPLRRSRAGCRVPTAVAATCHGRNRGRRRACPVVCVIARRRRIPRTLSSRGRSWVTSLRTPPVSDTASGMPWLSVRTWCLLPGRARSTWLGPLPSLCGPPGRGRSRSPPSTGPVASPTAASSAAPGAVGPTPRPRSRPPGAASRSCPSRSPVPGQVLPLDARMQHEQDPAQGLPV